MQKRPLDSSGRPQPQIDKDAPRVNEQIRVPEVRVIDQDGEMLGVMSPRDAVLKARDLGLDLIEISPNAAPPVCKIGDYGKYRYELQKKKNEARKNQKVVEIKELKIRPNIDIHDLEIKLRAAKRFLEEGDKVKFTLRFRGREMANLQVSTQVMKRVQEELGAIARVEVAPKLEGRQMMCILAPMPKVIEAKA